MTLNETYKKGGNLLKENGIDNCEFEARIIIEHVCSYNYSDFLLNRNSTLSNDLEEAILKKIDERCSGCPLQYVICGWEFIGLTFKVGEGVLIPRPETEELCKFVIDQIKDKPKPVVFDLCSGSGCIGLSIKHFNPNADVYLIEYSDDALMFLNQNRESLGFARSVPVIKGDVLGGFERFAFLPKPDVIVSNPPYIKTDEIPTLQKEVLFEPKMALDGGCDGYEFYDCFAQKWIDCVNEGGLFAVECGEQQAEYISNIFASHCKTVKIKRDFNDIERFVVAFK